MHQFEEGTTLDRFLLETMREHPEATGLIFKEKGVVEVVDIRDCEQPVL
jgi:hypothetical protein